MSRKQTHTVSNAKPQGIVIPATVITPIISGVTQRTEHKVVCIITSTSAAGGITRVVREG